VKRRGSDEPLRCSFCHKSQDVVGKLISAPSHYPEARICDECIAVCNSILEDDRIVPGTTYSREVLLDPEIAQAFPDSRSVNDALRQLLDIARRVSLEPQSSASSPPTSGQTPSEP
jgi:ATP-dependent Clp protease ATP-binding subunit ClpX